MTSPEKKIEEMVHEWEKHYSLVAHQSLVTGDLADEEIKDWLRTTLSQALQEQRDEIVGMVEGMKGEVREHYDDCDVKTGKSHKGECRCGLWRNHQRSGNQALDTLLDNLK